jgi:hypothetical protein
MAGLKAIRKKQFHKPVNLELFDHDIKMLNLYLSDFLKFFDVLFQSRSSRSPVFPVAQFHVNAVGHPQMIEDSAALGQLEGTSLFCAAHGASLGSQKPEFLSQVLMAGVGEASFDMPGEQCEQIVNSQIEEDPVDFLLNRGRQGHKEAGSSSGVSKRGRRKNSAQDAGVIKKKNSLNQTKYSRKKKNKELVLQELGQKLVSTEYDEALDELQQELLIFNQKKPDFWDDDILEYCEADKTAEGGCTLYSFVKEKFKGNFTKQKHGVLHIYLRKLAFEEIFNCVAIDPRIFDLDTLEDSIKKSQFYSSDFNDLVQEIFSQFCEAIKLYKKAIKKGEEVDIISLCCEKTKLMTSADRASALIYPKLILLSLHVMAKVPNRKLN